MIKVEKVFPLIADIIVYFNTIFVLQGGEPDFGTVAKMILNDFQRGKLPYFVKPPVDVVSYFICLMVYDMMSLLCLFCLYILNSLINMCKCVI